MPPRNKGTSAKKEVADQFYKDWEKLETHHDQLARNSRRNLYFASIFAIAVTLTGAVPTKIDALGITFSPPEQRYGLFLLAIVSAYFLGEYIFYCLKLYLGREVMSAPRDEALYTEFAKHFPEEDQSLNEYSLHIQTIDVLGFFLKYVAPVSVGLIGIALAVRKAFFDA